MFENISNHLFNQEELKQVEKHISKYPKKMAAIMPVLWMIQEKEDGYQSIL